MPVVVRTILTSLVPALETTNGPPVFVSVRMTMLTPSRSLGLTLLIVGVEPLSVRVTVKFKCVRLLIGVWQAYVVTLLRWALLMPAINSGRPVCRLTPRTVVTR